MARGSHGSSSFAAGGGGVQSPSKMVARDGPGARTDQRGVSKFKFNERGDMVGLCMQRVTSKKIMRKWSPRYFVLTPRALSLYKEVYEWNKGMPPKLFVNLHKLMTVSDVYIFQKQDKVQGPRQAFQFKIIENRLSPHESAAQYQQFTRRLPSEEVCKLGHTDQSAAKALREEIVKIIREKQNNAGASVGRQQVSGRYDGFGSGGGSNAPQSSRGSGTVHAFSAASWM